MQEQSVGSKVQERGRRVLNQSWVLWLLSGLLCQRYEALILGESIDSWPLEQIDDLIFELAIW